MDPVRFPPEIPLAPVVLFVYRRQDHTRQVVEALQRNSLAPRTDLFIYCDAAKDEAAAEGVQAVRSYVKGVTGFASVNVVERVENLGLAGSIVSGVTEMLERSDRVIVLEDDIVVSSCFLEFMNRALDEYATDSRVWHISGWNYPIRMGETPGVFFWPVMNCWGWATWADRWRHFERDAARLSREWDRRRIADFNLGGAHDFWSQVTANLSGRLNTWAIFWYASIFEHGGLCLNPTQTYVINIGRDGSGENCAESTEELTELCESPVQSFPVAVRVDQEAVRQVQEYYRSRTRGRLVGAARRMWGRLSHLLTSAGSRVGHG